MKNILCLLFASSLIFFSSQASGAEVAFSIQQNQLTWFNVDDPMIQGSITTSGLPNGFSGNGLSYDSGAQRLLFVGEDNSLNHSLYSVSLAGVTLQAGLSVDVGMVSNIGTISLGNSAQILGAGFHNGSYYGLVNGTDTLLKVNFAGVGGAIANTQTFNLPGTNTMFLGDIAFNADGDLWISGFNTGTVPNNMITDADRLWHFSSLDGENFTNEGAVQPPGTRFNGIFFDEAGTELYGYRVASDTYGIINQITGAFNSIYTGSPFNTGGDLTNGFSINVIPEPSSAFLILSAFTLSIFSRRRRQ